MAEKLGLKKKNSAKRTWKKTPTVYQMESTECGAASLAMILGYYGCNIPLEQLRIECGVSRDGCNARNILKAAKKFGLKGRGYSVEPDKLLEHPTPSIIHWNFNHFVVFEGVKGGVPIINDPGNGRRKLTWDELNDSFTGIVLVFEKTEELHKIPKESGLLKFAVKRLNGQKKDVLAILLAGLLLVVPGMIVPIFSKVFIDDILGQGNKEWTIWLILAMVLTVLFQVYFTWMKTHLLNLLQMKMALVSGYRFLEHMFKLPIPFFEQRYSGDLSQRVENNRSVNNFLTGELAEAILNVVVALFFMVLLFFYNVELTLIGLLGVSLSIGLSVLLARKLSDIATKGQQDEGKMIGSFFSGLSISSTLKASGAESQYTARLLGYAANCAHTQQKIGLTQQILDNVPVVITEVFDVIILMVGGLLVIRGSMTSGTLVAFSELLGSFTAPVNKLVGFLKQIKTAKADVNSVNDIEKYPISAQFSPDLEKVQIDEKLAGSVEMKNVSFGYNVTAPALIDNLNLSVKPGRTVALVGSSGSGKSTVGKLFSGLLDPWSGEILFDNIPLRNIPGDVYTSSVSTVSQDITIFSGTVRENLTLWNPFVSEPEIIRACKDACIHDAITLMPGAYDCHLSEGGDNLSGGQRQRLEIARALVSNPTILVMDEATSALDTIVEKEVMDNVRRRGCTCIIVAHRLSTIRDADEIIVLEHGQPVERGSHDELMALNGRYARLVGISG